MAATDVGGTVSGGSTKSVVSLGWVAARLNLPDMWDSGIIGSEVILGSA